MGSQRTAARAKARPAPAAAKESGPTKGTRPSASPVARPHPAAPRFALGAEVRTDVQSGISRPRYFSGAAAGTGQPLDASTQARMREQLGRPLDHVRVHTDLDASRSADSLSARAVTTGADIYFGRGEYAPHQSAGRELLAHELAHVVQQEGAAASGGASTVTSPGDDAERAADIVARTVSRGQRVPRSMLAKAATRVPTFARQQRPDQVDASLNSSLEIEDSHQGELGMVFERRLVHHRTLSIHTADGITAELIVNGEAILPLTAGTSGSIDSQLDVATHSGIGFTVLGTMGDGTPIAMMGLGDADHQSLRAVAAAQPEFVHFGLTPARQVQSLVDAIRGTPVTHVPVPSGHTVPSPPRPAPTPQAAPQHEETVDDDFSQLTPEERRAEAERSFWDEFSIPNILLNIVIGLALGALALGAIAAAVLGAPELAVGLVIAALAVAVIGLGMIIYSTVRDMMDRWEHGEFTEMALTALRGLLQAGAIFAGAALLVLGVAGIILGAPIELGALAIVAGGLVLAAVAVGLYMAYRDFERATEEHDRDEFDRDIDHSARGVEQAVSDVVVLIIQTAVGAGGRWIFGRGAPGMELPPGDTGGTPGPTTTPPAPAVDPATPAPAAPVTPVAPPAPAVPAAPAAPVDVLPVPPTDAQPVAPPAPAHLPAAPPVVDDQPVPGVLRVPRWMRNLPRYMQRDRLQNPPAIEPERTARMRDAIGAYRRNPEVPTRDDAPGSHGTPVRGGTVADAQTDIPTLDQTDFPGASREALPPALRHTPGTTGGDAFEAANPTAVDHAEHVALENLRAAIDAALADGSISRESLRGRTVFLLVEQEPCSSCASGAGGGRPGILQQFSARYPELTIEVRSLRTTRSYIYRGGRLLNP